MNARSNHTDYIKRGIIKGFAERARALCDEEFLEKELENLEDVFVANGYGREEVRETLNAKKVQREQTGEDERPPIGRMTVPYVAGLSEEFKRLGKSKGFSVFFTPGSKLRSISKIHQKPLGNKRSHAVYQIDCSCQKARYNGETKRRFTTRLSEHQASVRLTKADLESGNEQSAQDRMNKDDGGIARHSVECPSGIDWENSKVLSVETDTGVAS